MTMLDLMEKFSDAAGKPADLAAVPGIVWRNEAGKAILNIPRPLIKDLLFILPTPTRKQWRLSLLSR